jgi:hypothetical protein
MHIKSKFKSEKKIENKEKEKRKGQKGLSKARRTKQMKLDIKVGRMDPRKKKKKNLREISILRKLAKEKGEEEKAIKIGILYL